MPMKLICSALAICAVAALPLECKAAKTDAYWHGVISGEWTVGIDPNTGLSNWYSEAPPNGAARNVPSGTAKFNPGAKTFAVHVSEDATVETLQFHKDAPHYSFLVHAQDRLFIKGDGIVDKGKSHPKFFVTGSIIMSGPSTASDADFEVATQGTLSIENSNGPATAPHQVTARTVQTDGSVDIGVNTFALFGNYNQTLNGVLRLSLGKDFKGNLDVKGDVDLAGKIVVTGNADLQPGEYALVNATSVSGTFTRDSYVDVPNSLARHLKYTKTAVILVLKKKASRR